MYAETRSHQPIVQKYGGTSVGSPARIKAVAARIKRLHDKGYVRQAIVVSAMAGETNRLVGLVEEVNPNAPAKTYDMAVAAGEQVSVALLAAALAEQGINARPLLAYQLGVWTDELHSRARIQTIDTARLEEAWRQNSIPVIAGFQGVTRSMEITTLGRGGSDTSAVALAVALKAGFCEINTDVDGVFTADPRIVENARLIAKMDFEVALEMASLGSKVLHPRCVELGAKYKLPIVVRNSFKSDDAERTLVMAMSEDDIIESPMVSGITVDRNVARISICGLRRESAIITRIFENIAARDVNVDIIVHDRASDKPTECLGFTVGSSDLTATIEEVTRLKNQKEFESIDLKVESGLSKVSVVGVGMRSHSGVASKVFAALAEEEIEIHMISTSEIKISCVVAETDSERAVRKLHDRFF